MRILALLLFMFANAVQAIDFSGRLKLDANHYDAGDDTLEALVGQEVSSDITGQLRLELKQNINAWEMDMAWQLDARHGSSVKKDKLVNEAYPDFSSPYIDPDYWDLQGKITDGAYTQSQHNIDRLSLTYSQTNYVLRLGRQALTWGNGLVFHPMDLVNPFQPIDTDTVYKHGTDMVYGQWLFSNGSDIQMALVPHKQQRDALKSDPDNGKDTYALYANLYFGSLQWNLLLARDYADIVLGVGVNGPLADAVWNMEIIPTWLDDNTVKTSILLNISQASTMLNHNLNSFIEFYHNGFGKTDNRYTLIQLDPALTAHLVRGQQFVTGRDYLTLGATWEWTPLMQLIPTIILNLNDGSNLFDTQFSLSLSNNAFLKGGIRLPFGRRGSEFNGLKLLPNQDIYLARSRQAFLRLEVYF